MKQLIPISFVFLLWSCHTNSETFIGQWQILSAVEGDETISLQENRMHLKSDGTFSSYDGEQKKSENGRWSYEQQTRTLFIYGESDSEDSAWILSFTGGTLILQSTDSAIYLKAVNITK